jgi:hypothetical protein
MNFLKKLFSSASPPAPVQAPAHPLRRAAVYSANPHGGYWEIETTVAGTPFVLAIDAAPGQEPTAAQFRFFEQYADNPDKAFSKARVLLVPAFEKLARKPFPDRWTTALGFVGMSVPLGADEKKHWEVHFECLMCRDYALFTCSFDNGVASELEIDDEP